MFPEDWTQQNKPVKPLSCCCCCCCCVCITEIWGEMKWQGWKKTVSLKGASQRQTKQGCFHWAGAERKMTECGRAEAKARWLTHQQQGSSDMNWTQSGLSSALKHGHRRSSESRERLQGQRTHLHRAGFVLLMGGQVASDFSTADAMSSKDTWYLELSRGISQGRAVGNIKCQGTCINRRTFKKHTWHLGYLLKEIKLIMHQSAVCRVPTDNTTAARGDHLLCTIHLS